MFLQEVLSMKILATVIPLLLVMRGVKAGEPGDDPGVTAYPDTCDYESNEMCGDWCIDRDDWKYTTCGCRFLPVSDDEHCCLQPGGNCTRFSFAISCFEGHKMAMSSPCNYTRGPQCYNSYQHSLSLGPQSHYTCPDTCLPWQDMCRGISWCEDDHQLCGPDLRCPLQYDEGGSERNVTKHNIISSLVTGHYYCIGDTKIDDGKFDSADRSDETKVRAAQSPLDLNITSFTPCYTNDDNHPGVKCGKDCRASSVWCRRDDPTAPCETESGYIAMNNPILCRDPRVWSNVSCSLYWGDGRVGKYGFRCTGQNMRCAYPWYTVSSGEPTWGTTQCPDKSDQIFNSSLTCRQHLQQHLDFHYQKFCNEKYPYIQSTPLCTNITHWLSEKYIKVLPDEYYSDPHLCQSSCSNPSPDCRACTNTSYFPCPQSGQCVHPDLVCDGHPQCLMGEDEDLSMCYDKFIKMQIIQPRATFRCQSLFYKNMFIFATPRNNITECWGGEDELESGVNATMISVISAIFVILIYVGLKYSGLAKILLSAENQASSIERSQSFPHDFLDYKTLKKYSENHDQNEAIQDTNIHILNSIHTQTVNDNKQTCVDLYDLEQQIHEENETEIHLCLHKKLDPKVVENILDSGEPGCTTKCIEGLENCVGRRLIKDLQDGITKSPIIKEIIGTTRGAVKIGSKYIDLFKDIFLSIEILNAAGNMESVWRFPNNLSSIIVMMMFASILVPPFFSTLHLVVNRRNIIEEKSFSRTRKYATITLCWFASFLNPIILDAYYQELKEELRRLTQNRDIHALTILKKCRKIKNQMVTFHKIELGYFYSLSLIVFHLIIIQLSLFHLLCTCE